MRAFHTFVLLSLLSIMTKVTSADVIGAEGKGSPKKGATEKKEKTYVVSNVFCEKSLLAVVV